MRYCLAVAPGARGARGRGFSSIYVAIMLVAISGFVSFAVDYGRMRLAKTQLQGAADAAARAGASGVPVGIAEAQARAVSIAASNTCENTPISIDPAADIEFGTWNPSNRTFTVLAGTARSSANAVRVTARRSAARGNPLPLVFGRILGRSTCDVTASSISQVTIRPGSGIVGLNGITLNNNAFFGSYDSSTTTTPTTTNATDGAVVATNGTLSTSNNATVEGNVLLGPAGTVSGTTTVSGSTTATSTIVPPPMPPWAPGINPGGLPQNYTVNSNTLLPGGQYWFTSLTLNANLTFSGPATLYVNGNVSIDADLVAAGRIPSNLAIYQYGANRTFGDCGTNNMTIIADIIAPGSDFVAKNSFTFCGFAFFNTITTKNSAKFFYDESIGPASGGVSIKTVR